MGTISVTLPSDGETIDAADITGPINTIITAINGNLDENNFNFSTGAINTSKITGSSDFLFDFVASGLVWSGDSYGSTLAASMTSGVVFIGGARIAVAAVTARAFTASKDTYIDVNSAGTLVYQEVTNNAASPALAANSIRLGIIVSGANIAAVGSVNQGQENKVLPIASSIPYAVTDSLGNLICPRDPNRKILGYRQITTNFTTASATAVQVTGLSCPIIVPTGRKVKLTIYSAQVSDSSAANLSVTIWDGVVASGTQVQLSFNSITATTGQSISATTVLSPTGSKTYNVGLGTSAGTATFAAGATNPAYILAELV